MRRSDLVDVFIGTAGSGKAVVGPQVPHGMVKYSPDTVSLPNAGYDYDDDSVLGFSHTHIEGIGGSGGRGYIMLMPTVGAREFDQLKYLSPFSHDKEHAEVGLYEVELLRYGIRAELSATQCCSISRFTFPKSDSARVLVDLSHTLNSYGIAYGGKITVQSPRSLSGWGKFPVMYPNSQEVQPYFWLELSKPFNAVCCADGQVLENADTAEAKTLVTALEFSTEENETVLLRLGLSYISEAQAKKNLDAQIPDFDFDRVRESCKVQWDRSLSVLDVECGSEKTKRVFYADLYRSMNAPVDYTEEGGVCFVGSSETGEVRQKHGRRYYSDMWAIWDTFRATHPLQQLTEPTRQADVAQSLIDNFYGSGTLPVSPAPCKGIVPCMIGHHAVSVIAEDYAKGHRDFDVDTAAEAVLSCVMRTDAGQLGIPPDYAHLGYIPSDGKDPEEDHSVSETLELTYDDWCAASFAEALGKTEESRMLYERAANYKNVFHPESGFVRRRLRDGTWVEPFNPNDSHKRGFCECSPWEYTTLVPHDIQGVINLMGGDARMVRHIDGVFENNRFNHINETAFHIPFIYTFARAPYKTMEVCRRYMPTVHNDLPGGLYGEDDSGAMSSWFAFIALGLFSSCPGAPYYTLTSPAFRKWTLHLPDGKAFTVTANGNSEQNIYIQKAFLNGQVWNKAYLPYADIMAGGELVLEMGDTPSDWATDFDSAPPSMTKEAPQIEVLSVEGCRDVRAGEQAVVTVTLRNSGADGAAEIFVMHGAVPCGSRICCLDKDTKKSFDIAYTLYAADAAEITVGGKPFAVSVSGGYEKPFVCTDTKYDRPMDTHDTDFTVRCAVKNVSAYPRTEAVPCRLDGKTVHDRTVTLLPGEEKEIACTVPVRGIGTHTVQLGSGQPAAVDIAAAPDENWLQTHNVPADYFVSDRAVYIRAAGSQHQYYKHPTNRMDYGMLFRSQKVHGDFDASVRIEWEVYTTPYAMHGLVCRSSMLPLREDYTGTILCGAMSSRGFINHAYASERIEGQRNFEGAPEVPYFVRIRRTGQRFACFYSADGQSWTQTAVHEIPTAPDDLFVGLYVNSCVPEKRLVKFTDLKIKEN